MRCSDARQTGMRGCRLTKEVVAVQFSETTLGWLIRAALLIVVVGVPTGLSFAVHALVDNWAATVVIVLFLAACLASVLSGDQDGGE